jgi:predicted lipoprotein with Yx(FWY)xxD motif
MSPEHLGRRGAGSLATILAVVLALGTAITAAVALGSTSTATVRSRNNASLGKTVVVNPAGRTLYTLAPETTRHLLCKGPECLGLWPPLTVPSRATRLRNGPGVQGRLGLLRRANGRFQVTLRGKPLYRFAGDGHPGEARGDGLETFGGTWHVVTAATSQSPAASVPMGTPTTPATPTSPTPYGY